ncbi:MAG: glycosyl hydrolase-related protein [Acidobacteria bacterium]|nr:glycosyl hydrolase-related protein [Acidobacteriota bacterium]
MTKTLLNLLLCSLLLPISPAAQEKPLRILKLQPTPLFPRQEPLRQIANLQLLNDTARTMRCQVTVQLEKEAPVISTLEVPAGVSTHRVYIPDISAPRALKLTIRDEGAGSTIEHQQTWQPQRHWKVTIVKSSHEDIGYEDYIYKKQHNIANNIELGQFLSAPRENVTAAERDLDSQFHYTMESILFLRNYIEERSEMAWREVVEKHIKPGHMHLMGAPSGVHSHWMDYEELARMTYPGRREAKDRFDLDLKTFMIVDNPSLSWSGCQAVADAGFRYVARWGQSWRTGGNNDYATTKLPALFWWQSPDGRHRVLFGWRSHYGMGFWYGQQAGGYRTFVGSAADHVSRELQKVEDGSAIGPYSYDALIVPDYVDHDTPRFDTRVLPEWNNTYRYPEIRIGSPTRFFEYIEKNYGDRLPTLTGDLNNFSADYSTIDPESQGWKRRAARMLPLAEGIAAIAGLNDPNFQNPARLIARTFTRLFDYDEHSWPTLPRASDVQLFNAQWVKKNEAARARASAENALQHSLSALLKQVPTMEANSLVVFNPLAHERTDVVEVSADFTEVIDPATERSLPIQQIGDGKVIFIAPQVPSFGYKVFRTRRNSSQAAAPTSLEVNATTLANQFYRIEFDPQTSAIRSVYDKELERELVDQSAKHRFNELVYVHKNAREAKEGTEHSPARGKLSPGKAGAVRADFTVEINDEKTGAAITQRVTLYSGLKRIDIVNNLRHVRALYSDQYEDRYKDNLYYAFPIKVDDFVARVEYPGGVVRPYVDQLRWGSHDYLSANRWVDVSNKSFGVTMAVNEAPNVNLGEIRYNQFSIDYQSKSSHLYSYAYSNRMAGLLTLNADDVNATLHYSFTSHAGDWQANATRFGWSYASPLLAQVIAQPQKGVLPPRQTSFVKISAPNAQMTTLKNSEQPGRGLIVRLIETTGRETQAMLELPHFPVKQAFACDLVENDQRELTTPGKTINVKLAPYGFATVRVVADDGALPTITALKAEPIADSRVQLTWAGAGPGYYVYRSEDPNAPPTAYTLVARTTQPTFTDEGLKLDTPYFYYVAAVSKHNNQGAISAQAKTRTKKENTTPPAPVDELGVVRRAKDRLIVYWRKNQEPDVARYYLYRGERKDFTTDEQQPLAVLRPSSYFLQTYNDTGLKAGVTYFYKVVAEDWSGNRQTQSMTAWATTPAY